MNSKIKIALAAAMLAGTSAAMAQAQMPAVHASRGQGAQQQARDESACQTSARKRTGYDPISIAANSQPFQPGKDMTSVPIEAPTTAMGSSGGGATGAGPGEAGMPPQAGATGGSQAGATSTGMAETGTAQQPAETTGAAQAQAGTSGTAGTAQAGAMAPSGETAQAGAMPEHHKKHHKHHEGAMGASSAGATGAGGGQQYAMQNSQDVYNRAFAKCMTGRGYTVETTSP